MKFVECTSYDGARLVTDRHTHTHTHTQTTVTLVRMRTERLIMRVWHQDYPPLGILFLAYKYNFEDSMTAVRNATGQFFGGLLQPCTLHLDSLVSPASPFTREEGLGTGWRDYNTNII